MIPATRRLSTRRTLPLATVRPESGDIRRLKTFGGMTESLTHGEMTVGIKDPSFIDRELQSPTLMR